MPKLTLQQQRRAKHEHERALLDANLCKKCGLSPRGTNADGTRSQRCDPCKPNRSAIRSSSVRYLKNPPPRKVDEWGMADDYGYLDTPRFAVYCTMLRSLITRSKAPMSIADMKRALGDSFSERMHMDALDSISDSVECFQAGAMSRYRPITARGEAGKGWNKQLRWNNNQRPVTGSKTYPFALMDDTRRRELA